MTIFLRQKIQAIQKKAYHSVKLKCFQKLEKENLLLNNLKLLSQKILLLDQEQQKIILLVHLSFDEECSHADASRYLEAEFFLGS